MSVARDVQLLDAESALSDPPRGYEAIRQAAADNGLNITEFLALARNNDPFFCGSPAQKQKAEWFANLWSRFDFSSGVHLRRVHYRLVSEADVLMPDGSTYQNTEICWNVLGEASKAARYLSLVRADAFEDHKHPPPHAIRLSRDEQPEPDWSLGDEDMDWRLPEIAVDLAGQIAISMPRPIVDGYDYNDADQPYHIELWVEKSTMNDVLLPICRRYGANLVTSAGFQSITSVVNLFQRIDASGKPCRVFYISDFDPAGNGMPVAVARQIEFWRDEYLPGADVKLVPLMLTRDQIDQYDLPRIPVKESDRRKQSFESRHGEGAVELDALEALHPGEFAKIVTDAIEPYFDADLEYQLARQESEVIAEVFDEWSAMTAEQRARLSAITDQVKTIVAGYEDQVRQLSGALQAELRPMRDELESVRQDMQAIADEAEFSIQERIESEIEPPAEVQWLFDSSRPYVEQLAYYAAWKAGKGAA